MEITRDTPLTDFPGVGEARAKKLEKLGLSKAGDLLTWYPRDYEDRRKVHTIRDAPLEGRVCVEAMAAEHPRLSRIRKGLELGYRRFILLGGVGGRLEHTLGNLQLLDWLTLHGAQGFLAGEKTVATCLRDGKKITFPAAMEGYLSVFCNSGTAEGVNLSGLKFPLENHTLTGSFPLGVSNQFLGEPAVVSVEKGSLLLIWEDRGGFYAKLPKLWAE